MQCTDAGSLILGIWIWIAIFLFIVDRCRARGFCGLEEECHCNQRHGIVFGYMCDRYTAEEKEHRYDWMRYMFCCCPKDAIDPGDPDDYRRQWFTTEHKIQAAERRRRERREAEFRQRQENHRAIRDMTRRAHDQFEVASRATVAQMEAEDPDIEQRVAQEFGVNFV